MQSRIDPTPPDRIAILTHDLQPYGAQRVAVRLVESLVNDWSLACEVISLGAGPLAVPLRRIAVVHNVGPSWKRPSRELGPILHAIRARGARHAVLNTVIAGVAAPLLRELDFRVVGLVHEMPELITRNDLQGSLAQMVESAHVVVYPHASVHEAIRNAFPALPRAARFECFPQGLIRHNAWRARVAEARASVRHSLGLAPEARMVLGVGTGERRKGIDLFLQCAQLVNERLRGGCTFVWIGGIQPELKATLQTQGLLTQPPPEFLRLLDFQEDTAPYHAAADLFALTSREDPFPNVALETMDAGVPLVAFSGTGGGAHLAGVGAGRAVPAFDVEAYAAAIIDLLGDEDARRCQGAEAQRLVDHEYSFDTYVRRLLGLLRPPAGIAA